MTGARIRSHDGTCAVNSGIASPYASWSKLLTPQEHKVAERVLPGWSNALIADDLGCSVATVKKHLQRVYDKLGVSSRGVLISLAGRPDGGGDIGH